MLSSYKNFIGDQRHRLLEDAREAGIFARINGPLYIQDAESVFAEDDTKD